ncbi:MAG: hypothetical protein Q9208_007813 [Pyrenodesmia sp. 3 TL-2023]
MHPTCLQLLSCSSIFALAAGEPNLLTFATGGLGQVLGSTFGLPGTDATFDYVVVGGGTAGLTIATRLASDFAVSVAVIEAGGFYEIDNGNRSTVPAYASYYTGADPGNYQPLIDWGFVTEPQEVWYNRGIKDPSSFDPQGGPPHVSFSNYADAFGSWAQKGLTGVGMELQDGLNSGILRGASFSTLTIDPRNGYRSSSESSFLQAAPQNGTAPMIYKNTLATRLLLDSNNTATGVIVTTAGSYGIPALSYTLSARKEVIVSAGAFQSPQLLMVSGIGPQDQLRRNNIEVKKDLPGVGQNMWDHVLFGSSRRVKVQTASASANSAAVAARLSEQFRANGSGPLAAFGAGIYGWEDLPQPYRSALSNSSLQELDATDQELAVQGFKRAREIWQVLEDAGLTVDVGEEHFPGFNVTTDSDILNFIQRSLMTINHAAGTCKMGKPDDGMAVVDSRARVYGTRNLRVVDASSFPILPPGHPQSVVYALAEKIAADILGLEKPGEG